ncbi:hypothetical protein D3C86_2153050 [compost metagenome]
MICSNQAFGKFMKARGLGCTMRQPFPKHLIEHGYRIELNIRSSLMTIFIRRHTA